MRWLSRIILAAIAVSPFIVYAVAQTSRLHDAVATGGLQDVRRALKPWKSVDGVNRHGMTPLGLAQRHRKLDVARFLLEQGASIQLTSGGRKHDHFVEAVRQKQAEYVALFLERGDRLDFDAALAAAVANADLEMMRLCLDKGASGSDALFQAVAHAPRGPQRLSAVELLLSRGTTPPATRPDGGLLAEGTLYARPTFDNQMLELLLKNGLPVNARNGSRHTLLYIASRLKNVEAVRMLLVHGADANDGGAECRRGDSCTAPYRTALHEAVHLPSTLGKYSPETGRELVALLVKHGAQVDVGDPQGNTPLMVAVRDRNLAGVQALIAAGADPRLGLRDRTPLVLAEKLDDPRFREVLAQANLSRIDEARKARAQARARTIGPRFSPTYGTVPPPAR